MRKVSVVASKSVYPNDDCYHPHVSYPEYPWPDTVVKVGENQVYHSVRESLHLLDLDNGNYDKPNWNPFKDLIKTGDTVLLKPNMVRQSHLEKEEEFEQIITHGSIIRAVCDYVIIALNGTGKIVFADAPETDTDFKLVCERNGLKNLVLFYKKYSPDIRFDILDLRKEQWLKEDGVIVEKWKLSGDPEGYTVVKINECSEFYEHQSNKDYYGATFNKAETQRHHHGKVHEYLISSSILNADVLINLPKLKTHKKSGLTCCLKNMVGINGDKNWLPHHTEGTPAMGGDQFANNNMKEKLEYSLFGMLKAKAEKNIILKKGLGKVKAIGRAFFGSTEKVVRSGNWWGNDTVWRMILDLNKAVFFYDSSGGVKQKPRKMFCLVDAVIAGEGIGPMHADRKELGVLVAGFDPVIVDRLCADVMGFDYKKIPSIVNAFTIKDFGFTDGNPDDVKIVSNISELNGKISDIQFDSSWQFEPHFGWKGYIEK